MVDELIMSRTATTPLALDVTQNYRTWVANNSCTYMGLPANTKSAKQRSQRRQAILRIKGLSPHLTRKPTWVGPERMRSCG
jgi:hypothetical protein